MQKKVSDWIWIIVTLGLVLIPYAIFDKLAWVGRGETLDVCWAPVFVSMAALGVMTLLYLVIWAQMTGQRLKKHYPLLPALLYLLLDGYVMLPVEHLPLWGHIAGYVANGIAYTMSLAGVLLALWVYRCLHRPVQAA